MEKGKLWRRKHRKGHWNGQDISIEGLKQQRNREKQSWWVLNQEKSTDFWAGNNHIVNKTYGVFFLKYSLIFFHVASFAAHIFSTPQDLRLWSSTRTLLVKLQAHADALQGLWEICQAQAMKERHLRCAKPMICGELGCAISVVFGLYLFNIVHKIPWMCLYIYITYIILYVYIYVYHCISIPIGYYLRTFYHQYIPMIVRLSEAQKPRRRSSGNLNSPGRSERNHLWCWWIRLRSWVRPKM